MNKRKIVLLFSVIFCFCLSPIAHAMELDSSDTCCSECSSKQRGEYSSDSESSNDENAIVGGVVSKLQALRVKETGLSCETGGFDSDDDCCCYQNPCRAGIKRRFTGGRKYFETEFIDKSFFSVGTGSDRYAVGGYSFCVVYSDDLVDQFVYSIRFGLREILRIESFNGLVAEYKRVVSLKQKCDKRVWMRDCCAYSLIIGFTCAHAQAKKISADLRWLHFFK